MEFGGHSQTLAFFPWPLKLMSFLYAKIHLFHPNSSKVLTCFSTILKIQSSWSHLNQILVTQSMPGANPFKP
jgi:hypothetical protein